MPETKIWREETQLRHRAWMKVSTKQSQIAELAKKYRGEPLTSLHHYMDEEWMAQAFRQLRKQSAPGVDGESVKQYGEELERRNRELLELAKSGKYQAPPVKRVHIPKDGKETRPIGIPTCQDKVLQRAVAMLLEPIYEQEFYDFSYGFRPGRSAHQALNALWNGVMDNRVKWVLDVDIRKFFDTLDHGKLREILDQRIKDGVLRRLIDKWLSAGVMEEGEISYNEEGTPQGGVISPILSNVFLHEALDKWFVEEVKPRLKGRAFMIRFADDFVMGFEAKGDAERVMKVVPKRLERYGLSVNLEKTKLVRFWPSAPEKDAEPGNGTFDFLGFTHYWGRNWKGKWVVKRKTSRKRFARALKAIGEWCRKNRHSPLSEQQSALSAKLRGHFGYYGMTGNSRALVHFREEVRRVWFKWLGRRSRQRDDLRWEQFDLLWTVHYPLPPARIKHSVFRVKPCFGGTGCAEGARPDLWGSG